jgi:hypothetical protein
MENAWVHVNPRYLNEHNADQSSKLGVSLTVTVLVIGSRLIIVVDHVVVLR